MFKGNKILLLGFARSGYEAAKLLISRGNKVIVNDYAEISEDDEKLLELKKKGVEFITGSHPDDLVDDSFDYVIKNPGIAIDHKYVLKARELGVEVINETEMAFRLLPEDKNIKIIGITGTNGKTTTTTLIHEMLIKDGKKAHLAGNIGFPLCGFLEKLEDNDILVNEVSIQQLENFSKYRPDIAIFTNLSEAHIDFMKTYENYKQTKLRIFKNQDSSNIAILNLDNEELIRYTKDIKATTKYFSSQGSINGCYIKDEAIYYYDEKIVNLSNIKLVGIHNYENIMAAIMAVKEFEVTNEAITEVVKEFGGVEHRLEFIKEVEGRLFYNDSKATNIISTQIALASFNQPTIVILGGEERNQDFNELKEYSANIKTIIGIGECRARVEEFGNSLNIPTFIFETLEEAFPKTLESSSKGDVILLSPASASWDQYKCFEDRGNEYKELIEKI